MGREVVLLHGQPGSGSDWRQVADQLPGTLRVVALDRPGYGTNRQRAGGFAFNARAVLAELDARGIERAVLVGHSYGGGVALSLARLAPGRGEALSLLASLKKWPLLMLAVFLASFFPVGLYMLGVPSVFRLIGVADLLYFVATLWLLVAWVRTFPAKAWFVSLRN